MCKTNHNIMKTVTISFSLTERSFLICQKSVNGISQSTYLCRQQ